MTNKNSHHIWFYVIFFTLSIISIGYSQNNSTDYTNSFTVPPAIDVTIHYYNKHIYFKGNPIIVELQIINKGLKPYVFRTSYTKIFTFDFNILTQENQKVEHSNSWVIERTKYEPVFIDEISLKPNEIYGVRIDINDWFNFTEPGKYYLRGIFYPNLITDPSIRFFSSNELLLDLRPPYPQKVREKVKAEEIKKLKAQNLPPYQVIDLLLTSLMKRDFETYFLYINFDKFIQQFSNARNKYLASRDIDKPKVIDEFKAYLEGKNKLESVPFSETIPVNYEIIKTTIEKKNARVEVIETFKFQRLIEKKRYSYYLHQYGSIWLLERYEVVNISG